MLQFFKENSVPLSKAKTMNPEELEGKIVIGEFLEVERPGYVKEYAKLQKRLEVINHAN